MVRWVVVGEVKEQSSLVQNGLPRGFPRTRYLYPKTGTEAACYTQLYMCGGK